MLQIEQISSSLLSEMSVVPLCLLLVLAFHLLDPVDACAKRRRSLDLKRGELNSFWKMKN